jgi:hypothetical protein
MEMLISVDIFPSYLLLFLPLKMWLYKMQYNTIIDI